MFPVWLGFRGGKGVATALGVLIALAWPVALVAGAAVAGDCAASSTIPRWRRWSPRSPTAARRARSPTGRRAMLIAGIALLVIAAAPREYPAACSPAPRAGSPSERAETRTWPRANSTRRSASTGCGSAAPRRRPGHLFRPAAPLRLGRGPRSTRCRGCPRANGRSRDAATRAEAEAELAALDRLGARLAVLGRAALSERCSPRSRTRRRC